MPDLNDRERLDALEELIIDELARIWNCWPDGGPSGLFDHERFESWKDSMRRALEEKQQAVAGRSDD